MNSTNKVQFTKRRTLYLKHNVIYLSSYSGEGNVPMNVEAHFYIDKAKKTVFCEIQPQYLSKQLNYIKSFIGMEKDIYHFLTSHRIIKGVSRRDFFNSSYDEYNSYLKFTGKARCCPEDEFDEYIGMKIAFERALKVYSKLDTKLLQLGMDYFKQNIGNTITTDRINKLFEQKITH